jgi:pimeloyl-ACP methyl ester carboxylesterase
MVCDPVTVTGIKDAVVALEAKGLTGAEIERRWSVLLDRLLGHVGSFPALQADEPSQHDAAYCLFLHSLAIRTMRFSPSWATAVAARLGITRPVAVVDAAGLDAAGAGPRESAPA